MQKRFLITPGPTPVPPEVLSALSMAPVPLAAKTMMSFSVW